MPVHRGVNFYQWGENGAKYYYIVGNALSRKQARAKAVLQGKAIKARGGS